MNTKTQIFELIGLPYHWRDDLRVLVVDHSLNKLMPNLMCFDAVIVSVYLSTNDSCRSKVQIFFIITILGTKSYYGILYFKTI